MGNVLTIRFERFTVFKPPALPEVMTLEKESRGGVQKRERIIGGVEGCLER